MIFKQLSEQLGQLGQLLQQLTQEQYTYQSRYLGGATIGGHTRHILELLGCAINGHEDGTVDYLNRERNLLLETDIDFSIDVLKKIGGSATLEDKVLQVAGEYEKVGTTYYREVVYNIEHTIHHLAMIKVALTEMGLTLTNANFGMAYSTIKYNEEKKLEIHQ